MLKIIKKKGWRENYLVFSPPSPPINFSARSSFLVQRSTCKQAKLVTSNQVEDKKKEQINNPVTSN